MPNAVLSATSYPSTNVVTFAVDAWNEREWRSRKPFTAAATILARSAGDGHDQRRAHLVVCADVCPV